MIRSLLSHSISSTTCAVIGNAPYSSDLSEQIDNSYVMRCNVFTIPTKGLGTRTDLNISSLYRYDNRTLDCPILGVLPLSDTLYQPYTKEKTQHLTWIRTRNRLLANLNEVWTYDDTDEYADVFREVVGEINAFPTVGLMGIATARWIGFKHIILTGFTFFQTKQKYYTDISRPFCYHHDPVAEMALVNRWREEDDIGYTLDKLTQQILNDNRQNR